MKRIISIITAFLMLLSITSCTGSMQNDDGNSMLEFDASVEEASEEVSEDEDEFESSETEESEDFASSEINSDEERTNAESELTSSNEDVVMRRTSRNKGRDLSRNSKIEKEKVFHTVTFKNGNTVLKTQKVQHRKSAVAPKEPKKEGTFFTNWDKKFDNVKKDITVKAEWLSKEQMKKFNSYEGQLLIKEMNKAKNNKLFRILIFRSNFNINFEKIARQKIGDLPDNPTIEEMDIYYSEEYDVMETLKYEEAFAFISKYTNKTRIVHNTKPPGTIEAKITKSEIIALAQNKDVTGIAFPKKDYIPDHEQFIDGEP